MGDVEFGAGGAGLGVALTDNSRTGGEAALTTNLHGTVFEDGQPFTPFSPSLMLASGDAYYNPIGASSKGLTTALSGSGMVGVGGQFSPYRNMTSYGIYPTTSMEFQKVTNLYYLGFASGDLSLNYHQDSSNRLAGNIGMETGVVTYPGNYDNLILMLAPMVMLGKTAYYEGALYNSIREETTGGLQFGGRVRAVLDDDGTLLKKGIMYLSAEVLYDPVANESNPDGFSWEALQINGNATLRLGYDWLLHGLVQRASFQSPEAGHKDFTETNVNLTLLRRF